MFWYHSTWKLALMGLAALLLVFAGTLGFLTLKYWRQIKSGGGAGVLQQLVGQGFTPSVSGASPQTAVDRVQLENTDDPYLGRPTAPTVIVGFMDFKCPFSKISAPITRQVMDKYGYKIKYIFRYFPAESLYPGANQLAMVMRCAEKQGKFWPAHDWVFGSQDQFPAEELGPEDLANLADNLSLDKAELNACLTDLATADKVRADYLDGVRFGARGTPTWFVNGFKVEGVVPFERWQEFLDNQTVK